MTVLRRKMFRFHCFFSIRITDAVIWVEYVGVAGERIQVWHRTPGPRTAVGEEEILHGQTQETVDKVSDRVICTQISFDTYCYTHLIHIDAIIWYILMHLFDTYRYAHLIHIDTHIWYILIHPSDKYSFIHLISNRLIHTDTPIWYTWYIHSFYAHWFRLIQIVYCVLQGERPRPDTGRYPYHLTSAPEWTSLYRRWLQPQTAHHEICGLTLWIFTVFFRPLRGPITHRGAISPRMGVAALDHHEILLHW